MEIEIHIYSRYEGTFTISEGKTPICIARPLDEAMKHLRDHLEQKEPKP